MNICENCGLPEDGLRVRNVTLRANGKRLCADCAAIDDLAARIEQMEERFNNWVQTHPPNEDFDAVDQD